MRSSAAVPEITEGLSSGITIRHMMIVLQYSGLMLSRVSL